MNSDLQLISLSNFMQHGSDYEMKKHQKESHSPRRARSENSSNDAIGGFVGQVNLYDSFLM